MSSEQTLATSASPLAPARQLVRARGRAQADDVAVDEAPRPVKSKEWLPVLVGAYARRPSRWSTGQVFFATMSALGLFYLALYHPYWVRGGDSEFYLVVARNLARGEGFRYNGQPVGLVPPGWPVLLAMGMWVTSSIAALKLMLLGFVFVYLGCAFYVLRRYAGAWWCAAVTLVIGILQPTWQLSFWFYSEGPFLAASWLALLLAVQAREQHGRGRDGWNTWWRVIAVLVLLWLTISIRWTGLLWTPMLALALLDRRRLARLRPNRKLELRLWPRRIDRMWVAAGLVVLVGLGTFLAWRVALKVDPASIDPRYSAFEAGNYSLINEHGRPSVSTHIERFLNGPQWLSVLWWNYPGRTGPFRLIFFFLAALTVIPLAWAGAVGLARRQWLWLGALLAWIPVMVTWPHAIDRYSLPVAPLLALGTMLGAVWLRRWLSRPVDGRGRYLLLLAGAMVALWACFIAVAVPAWTSAYNFGPRVIGRYLEPIALGMPEWISDDVARPSAMALSATVLLAGLVALGVWRTSRLMRAEPGPRRLPALLRNLPAYILAGWLFVLFSYNLGFYAMEAWVARDPPRRFEAGQQQAMNAIGHYLLVNDADVYPGEVAIAPLRALNNSRFYTLGPRRHGVWVIARPAIDVPFGLTHEPGQEPGRWQLRPPYAPQMGPEDYLDPRLVEWLTRRHVRWYIVSPNQERFLHFRRQPWRIGPAQTPMADAEAAEEPPPGEGAEQELPPPDQAEEQPLAGVTREEAEPSATPPPAERLPDWMLFEITPLGVRRVDVLDQPADVLVVPGLEDVRSVPGRRWLPIPYN